MICITDGFLIANKKPPPQNMRRWAQGGNPFLLVNGILQGLASLENGSLGRFDLDLLAGAGVAGNAAGTLANLEAAEANDLNLLASSQSLGDYFGEANDGQFGLLLVEAGLCGNSSGDKYNVSMTPLGSLPSAMGERYFIS